MNSQHCLSFLIALIIGIIHGSCERSEGSSLDVETYITLLKSNQYDSADLPVLSYRDIPALLEYRNETQTITNYPHNPISSLFYPECSLGIYVLWTIESIRAVSIDNKYLIRRFPSQNPILSLRNSDELELVHTQESHDIAAQAYYNWWHTDLIWDQLKCLDPLQETDFKWH